MFTIVTVFKKQKRFFDEVNASPGSEQSEESHQGNVYQRSQ
jgi:hypothetical protein